MTDDTRDRVIALEVEVRTLDEKLTGMARKVDEMHSFLLQAKGARWAIIAMASVGGFLAGTAAKLFPWLWSLPK